MAPVAASTKEEKGNMVQSAFPHDWHFTFGCDAGRLATRTLALGEKPLFVCVLLVLLLSRNTVRTRSPSYSVTSVFSSFANVSEDVCGKTETSSSLIVLTRCHAGV